MAGTQVLFVPNPAGLAILLRSPYGAVGRDLLRRGLRVEAQAKVNASGRPGPNVDTGRLRSSIRADLVERNGGVVCRVGAYTEYASFVEFGTDRAPAYLYLRPALSAAR
jgi:bacteriophage HK97-gp10 putative tail-component